MEWKVWTPVALSDAESRGYPQGLVAQSRLHREKASDKAADAGESWEARAWARRGEGCAEEKRGTIARLEKRKHEILHGRSGSCVCLFLGLRTLLRYLQCPLMRERRRKVHSIISHLFYKPFTKCHKTFPTETKRMNYNKNKKYLLPQFSVSHCICCNTLKLIRSLIMALQFEVMGLRSVSTFSLVNGWRRWLSCLSWLGHQKYCLNKNIQ